MSQLDVAILRTILYASLFQFPLTIEELHYFLIHDHETSLQDIQQAIQHSSSLQSRLCRKNGYITFAENSEFITSRIAKEAITQKLSQNAFKYGKWFSYIPFVRMVSLTGALSARNPAHSQDDFDYLLVTQKGRVWFARAWAIVIVRIARLWGVNLCPNYVLAEDQLYQQKQDLFMAREITQMISIFGSELQVKLQQENIWTKKYLPNANGDDLYGEKSEQRQNTLGKGLKKGLEKLFSGYIGNMLEIWEFRRKSKRFAPQVDLPESTAQIDEGHVKGHFQDHGNPILRDYQQGLRQHNLEVYSLDMVGD